MSFRELRSFTEIMRTLGFPRLISMENFRVPNFELVADCLLWLVQRYYPGHDISDEISTEADRVNFLQQVAQVMLTKARMKLNIKRLYSADGLAVKELLKIAALLYQATRTATTEEEDSVDAVDFSVALKNFNGKEIKQYASEIIRAGAGLYDALAQEPELREHRSHAAAGPLDTEFVERSIHEAIRQVEDHIKALEGQLEELDRTEKQLDSKIEKRKQELERSEKRLATLQTVRPQYMDEYERLQGDLQLLYQSYLDRFRNLEYLESELESYYRAEQEKVEDQERRHKKMIKRLADEELKVLRGELEVDENGISNDLGNGEEEELEDDDDDEAEVERPAAARGGAKPTKTSSQKNTNISITPAARQQQQPAGQDGRQVVGSLNPGLVDDDDDSIDDADDDADEAVELDAGMDADLKGDDIDELLSDDLDGSIDNDPLPPSAAPPAPAPAPAAPSAPRAAPPMGGSKGPVPRKDEDQGDDDDLLLDDDDDSEENDF